MSDTKCDYVTVNDHQVNESSTTVLTDEDVNSPTQLHQNQEENKEETEEAQLEDSSNEASENLVDTNEEISNQSQDQKVTATQSYEEDANSLKTLRVTKVIPLRAVSMAKPESISGTDLLCPVSQNTEEPLAERDMKPHTIYITQNNTPCISILPSLGHTSGATTHTSSEPNHDIKEMSKLEACLKQPLQAKSNSKLAIYYDYNF
jgi:hypothetical protein